MMKVSRNNSLKSILMLLVAGLIVTSCNESGTGNTDTELEAQTAQDIPANVDGQRGGPPDFTFFNLATGEIVPDSDSASTQWDLGFSSTTIIINGGTSGPGQGGAVILDVPFADVDTAPSTGYNVDSESSLAIPTGSGNGWYNYTGQGNPPAAIIPIPDKTIIVRTANGNYAKVEILSYYEGNPDTSTDEFADQQTRPAGRYYTFQYVLQTDGSTSLN